MVAAALTLLLGCVTEYTAMPPGGADESTADGSGTPASGTAVPATDDDVEVCEGDEVRCGDECVDLDFDSAHCGDCHDPCLLDTMCVAGECVSPCGPGCDDDVHVCDQGVCVCRPGLLNCSGICVNAESDPDHCGDCWDPCPDAAPQCGAGECQSDCGDFDDACEGTCTDTAVDPFNCGVCGNICAPDELCVDGDCVLYEPIDPVQCSRCPCAGACEATCCWSDFIDGPVCVEGPLCPVP